MAINTKAIKTRIKSVKNTKKITKAMEMVSAAKMRRAVESTLATRTYALLARELMQHLAHMDVSAFPLLKNRPVRNVLVVFISSNRGLCGSFNTNIFKKTAAFLRDLRAKETDAAVHVVGLGKKSAVFAKKQGYTLPAVFDDIGETPEIEDILPVTKLAIEGFEGGLYDKVYVAYTDYKSSLSQEPKVRQLLPVSKHDIDEMIGEIGKDVGRDNETPAQTFPIDRYVFEPNTETILTYVLPRLVEIQLYQAILESAASEHSARMMAMRNASDAATEMIGSLNVSFNKARQAAITQEIAEIAGGAAALG